MRNVLQELLELATELQDTAPRGTEDPSGWMNRARDFAEDCGRNGRLSRLLFTKIPLKEQGLLFRNVEVLREASGGYNVGLRGRLDTALSGIVKVLRRETTAEPERAFAIGHIPQYTNGLSPVEKQFLDVIWNHFLIFDNAFPLRSVPRVIGKQSIEDAFSGLNGGLIYETVEQGDHYFKLTLHGALLTGYGAVLASLLVRLLELVKELYESDSFIKALTREQVMARLEVSETDAKLLFKLMYLGLPPRMPISLSRWGQDGSSWTIDITDEVISLFRAENVVSYLDERLSAGYRFEEPCLYEQRRKHELQDGALLNRSPLFVAETANPLDATRQPYLSLSRVEDLRALTSQKFDCTRLVCMCEELNDCAAQENAHAVIMLTRAILDHVPPVFGFKTFAEVAAQYKGGGTSFKRSLERLENQSRKVADRLLHMPIRESEVAPNMHEVSFVSELETLFGEVVRVLKAH